MKHFSWQDWLALQGAGRRKEESKMEFAGMHRCVEEYLSLFHRRMKPFRPEHQPSAY